MDTCVILVINSILLNNGLALNHYPTDLICSSQVFKNIWQS